MFNRKNISLLILLLFLMAVCKGLFESPWFRDILSFDAEKEVVSNEINSEIVSVQYAKPEIFAEVIIDVSGSMWGQFRGVNKIINSKGVMNVLLKDLPENVHLGLRTFGGAGESHLEIPLGVNNREKMQQVLEKLRPSGKSPIGYAMSQAGADLMQVQGQRYILLISDGIDNGEIDPIQKASELKKQGIITHVIFVPGGEEDGASKLQEIARIGGGKYFTFDEKDLIVPTMTLPN